MFYPKPVQKPHPPIWIGGESAPALRRTIRFAAAWYPGNNSQTVPLDTPARLAAGIGRVNKACEAAGRDPETMEVALLVQNYFEWEPYKIADGSARRLFTGSSADMIDDAGALEAVGCDHVALRLGGDTAEEAVARIERFGAEVIGKIKA
jgi:alkanesulfonate monooxygenase SsuD/methylene tetrahydromethanopterin reductase-like flavin-dependent oxidoreductase (luciferase family)